MIILSIETSCDETALAMVKANGGVKNPSFETIKNLISSQIKIHRPFGGVVPSLAKREHQKNLPLLYKKLNIKNTDIIDKIAVTVGPGLEPALWTGINFAKELSKNIKKPLMGVNHIEGHMYSFLLGNDAKKKARLKTSKIFPSINLIASGGHTILLLMENMTEWKKLGETRDDAAGEAFDKIARMINLPYPGGPEIEKMAKKGSPKIYFPRPMMHSKNYDFSFSGLKTSVFYYLRELGFANANKINKKIKIKESAAADIAASFEQAAVDVLVHKTVKAAKEFKTKSIIISGGVASNKFLRNAFKKESKKAGINFFAPPQKYNTDNAVMIAVSGYINSIIKKAYPIKANGDLKIKK